MVEYKVTGKNKKELAEDYINNHLGEDIKFLNNDKVITGWVQKVVARSGEIYYASIEGDGTTRGTYFLPNIATSLYRLSRKSK